MVNAGYKVAVIEQTETPRELKERLDNTLDNTKGGKKNKADKVVNRQMYQMVTKGTFRSSEDNYEPKWIMSF